MSDDNEELRKELHDAIVEYAWQRIDEIRREEIMREAQ